MLLSPSGSRPVPGGVRDFSPALSDKVTFHTCCVGTPSGVLCQFFLALNSLSLPGSSFCQERLEVGQGIIFGEMSPSFPPSCFPPPGGAWDKSSAGIWYLGGCGVFPRAFIPNRAWIWLWLSFPGGSAASPQAGCAPSILPVTSGACDKGQHERKQPQVVPEEPQLGYERGFVQEKLLQPRSSHPFRDFTALWVRHLGTGLKGGLGRVNGWSWSHHSNLSKESRSKIHGIPADHLLWDSQLTGKFR